MNRISKSYFKYHVLTASALVGAYFLIAYLLFSDLIVMTEARGFIIRGREFPGLLELFGSLLIPPGGNARPLSMASFSVIGAACGFDNVCINVFQILLVCLAGILLYSHAVQVFRSLRVASLITILWLFSPPVFDAVIWQATNHDKLAAVFVLGSLIVSWSVKDKPNNVLMVLWSNTVIFVLLLFAYGAKESSFFLMPLILIQHLLYARNTREFMVRGLPKLVVPMVFSIYFMIGYFMKLNEKWAEYVSSGNVLDTVQMHASYFFAGNEVSIIYTSLFSLVYIVLICLIALNIFSRRFVWDDDSKALLYSFIFLALSELIILKVRMSSQQPYKMYIPMFGFLFALFSASRLAFSFIENAKRLALLKTAKIVSIILLIGLSFNYARQLDADSEYMMVRRHSQNMFKSMQTIRDTLDVSEDKTYNFYLPFVPHSLSYFFRAGYQTTDPFLINFIYETKGDYRAETYTLQYYYSLPMSKLRASTDEYHIVLDENFRILNIIKNQ